MSRGAPNPPASEPVPAPDQGDLERLAYELSTPPFHAVLRPEPVSADGPQGTVVVRLRHRPEFGRRKGDDHYHGGVIASLIDLTAHAAIAVRVRRMVPTIDLRIDYLRAAPAGDLLATGRLLTAGRSIGRADVEVRSSDGRLVAVGRGAFSMLSGQS